MKSIRCASIVITEDCNMACTFCYEKKKSPAIMTVDTVQKVIDFIFSNQKAEQDLFLYWFGGEPFLNFEVFRFGVTYANKKAAKAGITVKHRIPTNGTVWNDEIEQFFVDHPDILLQISWQGNSEIQNAERGAAAAVEKTVARAVAKISNLLDVQIQILPQHIHNLSESVDHIVRATKGKASLMLRPVPEADGWDDSRLEELENQMYRCCQKHGNLIKRAVQWESGEIDYMNDCTAGREFCTFVPSGDIFVCHRFYFGQRHKGDQFKIGNLQTGFINTAFTKKLGNCRRDSLVGCSTCSALRTCYSCYACNYEMTGKLLKSSIVNCAVNRAYAAGIHKYLQEKKQVPQKLDVQKILTEQVLPILVNAIGQIQVLNNKVAALEQQREAALFHLTGGDV